LESDTGRIVGTPQETAYGTLVFAVIDAHGRMAYLDSVFKVVEPLQMISEKMPEGCIGENYQESIMVTGGIHPLSFTCANPLPPGLMIDKKTGMIYGIPNRIGYYNFNVTVTDQKAPAPQLINQTLSIRISNKLTIISSSILPKVQKNNEMTPFILKAAGGKSPLIWEITEGALPGGIQLDQNKGIISGIPTDKGNASFTIKVTDSDGTAAEKEFYWLISDSLSFTTRILAEPVKDEAYEQILNGRGGYPPYYWRITSGALLSGLEFNNTTGTIYGIPLKENEIRSFTIEISDSDTPAQTASQTFTIMTTSKKLYIVSSEIPLARKNQMYKQLIRASLGTPPYTWRIKSGNLPNGISLIDDSEMARLEGKPTKIGEYYFEIEVSDSTLPKNVAIQPFILDVEGSVAIITESLKKACADQEYSDRIQVTNGTLPYKFQIVEDQGHLPGLLQLNPLSGEITGQSDLQPGEHSTFTVRVTDSGSPPVSDERSFFIYAVNCSLDISPENLPNASVMAVFKVKLTGNGGISPYRFSTDSGLLPPGIYFDTQEGILSGYPEHEGKYRFTIQMTDANGNIARENYTMAVFPCEICPKISGNIQHDSGGGMPEATILFRDANGYTRTAIIDEDGFYEMKVPPGWSGTIIPVRSGYSFIPENLIYQQLMTDQLHQDFMASAIKFTLSGKVELREKNQGLANIRLRYGVAGFTVNTNEQGVFSIVVPFRWSGTITPESIAYEFTPQSMTIESVYSDLNQINFSAISTNQPQINVSPLSLIFQKSGMKKTIKKNISPLPRSSSDYGTGLIVPDEVEKYWETHTPNYSYRKRKDLAEKKDWSAFDSPVKDQGRCGSCWAFASVGLLENVANQAGLMTNVDLSEQSLVSCAYPTSERYGCDGGWYFEAFNYVKNHNIPSESCFPYEFQNGQCDARCGMPDYEITLNNFTPPQGLWRYDFNVDDIKGALQDGPLCIAMAVPKNFFKYSGGIYDYQGIQLSGVSHAVLLVGYDNTLHCFKAKNSWGTDWGEDGYFRIAYNDTEDINFGAYAGTATGIMKHGQGKNITITNTGTGNLEIQRIFSNSSWLGFENPDISVIEPDSQCLISVYIKDWSQISGINQTGILTINSNDPINNVTKVNVKAMILAQLNRPELSVSPPFESENYVDNETIIIISNYDDNQQTFSLSNIGEGDMGWNVQSNTQWIVMNSSISGTNSGIINIEFTENYGLSERYGNIIVSAIGALNSPQTVQIRQRCYPFPDIDQNNLLSMLDVIQMLRSIAGMQINSDHELITIQDVILSLNRLSQNY